jgi:hypothetical protein
MKENRFLEETLSDNTQTVNCQQCEDCIHRDDGTVWSNHFTKSCCKMFQYPKFKPLEVINNTGECIYYSNN